MLYASKVTDSASSEEFAQVDLNLLAQCFHLTSVALSAMPSHAGLQTSKVPRWIPDVTVVLEVRFPHMYLGSFARTVALLMELSHISTSFKLNL